MYLFAQGNVAVEFYGESLCPYCAEFTTSVLAPLFQNGLYKHFNLTLAPYGNARNTSEESMKPEIFHFWFNQ